MTSEKEDYSGFALSAGREVKVLTAGFVSSLHLGQIRGNGNVYGSIGKGGTDGGTDAGCRRRGSRKLLRARQTRARLEACYEGGTTSKNDTETRGRFVRKNVTDDRELKDDNAKRAVTIDNVKEDATYGETDDSKVRKGRKQVRRTLSSESRAKISEALKGRRKSESHKQSLSKRFTGSGNPMYGRKRSAETRAKISAALLARRHEKEKDNEQQIFSSLPEEGLAESQITPSMRKIKQQATASRLVTSLAAGVSNRKNSNAADERIDDILKRVANLDAPPDNVARLIHKTKVQRRNGKNEDNEQTTEIDDNSVADAHEHMNQKRLRPAQTVKKGAKKRNGQIKLASVPCVKCNGRGMTTCEQCVGTFGVASIRCPACFGAGSVFCEGCDGAGQVYPNT